MLEDLYKDNKTAYKKLLELEQLTTESNELYGYFDELLSMLNSEKSFVRIRGFRLICSLSKWDNENKINENIDKILDCFDDNNGINIRQYLSKINLILLYKIELTDKIVNKLKTINIFKYKETLQSLIEKDIKELLK